MEHMVRYTGTNVSFVNTTSRTWREAEELFGSAVGVSDP